MNYEKIFKVIIIHIIIFIFIAMFANLAMYLDKFSAVHYTKYWYYIPIHVYVALIISLILSLIVPHISVLISMYKKEDETEEKM